jgi:hypothetical protein
MRQLVSMSILSGWRCWGRSAKLDEFAAMV